MKKALILQSSPRINGNVYKMAKKVEDEFKEKGFETDFVDVAKLDFHNCTGCMSCRKSGKCIFSDDADKIGEKMSKSDIIVVATPVWWGNIPGFLKSIFDRNVFRMMGESKHGIPKPLMKGKTGILIAACTTPFPFNWICGQTTGAKRAVKEIFKSSGIKLKKVISIAGTKKIEKK